MGAHDVRNREIADMLSRHAERLRPREDTYISQQQIEGSPTTLEQINDFTEDVQRGRIQAQMAHPGQEGIDAGPVEPGQMIPEDFDRTYPEVLNIKNKTAADARAPQWMDDIKSGKTLIKNGDGSVSTMKSITFESDGKVYLAPSIRVMDGKPVELSPDEAVKVAKKNHDAIPFNSQKEADKFDEKFHEQEYKRLGVGGSSKNKWPKTGSI